MTNDDKEIIKIIAVEKFADKLKTYIMENCCVTDDDVDKIYKEINRLVKEMTEG